MEMNLIAFRFKQ